MIKNEKIITDLLDLAQYLDLKELQWLDDNLKTIINSKGGNKENHEEQLLLNCISYLFEIWNNESVDDIRKSFERLGFKREDMNYYEINEDLYYIEEDKKSSWERY